MDIKRRICKCLEENGVAVESDGKIEIMESISFISSIVSIEEEFNIEFPDEILSLDLVNNVENLQKVIESLLINDNNSQV